MQPEEDPFEPARQLWAGRFQGVLSTQSLAEPGYPFGSVVPYCLDAEGLPLFLLSHLAQHTRNLDAEPRCAFTVAEPTDKDIQQSLRLTCLGQCSRVPQEDAVATARYVRYFPSAGMYLEALNFRMYRLRPLRFHYNGGFATARWAGSERIVRASPFDEALRTAVIRCVDSVDAPTLMLSLAVEGPATEPVRVVGLDPWGMDLRWGDCLRRIPFPRSLMSATEIDGYLRNGLRSG
ncbi:MAG: pyridoxamine 5'-phosphate oxidase family protein [Chromatiaceae bacterium]